MPPKTPVNMPKNKKCIRNHGDSSTTGVFCRRCDKDIKTTLSLFDEHRKNCKGPTEVQGKDKEAFKDNKGQVADAGKGDKKTNGVGNKKAKAKAKRNKKAKAKRNKKH